MQRSKPADEQSLKLAATVRRGLVVGLVFGGLVVVAYVLHEALDDQGKTTEGAIQMMATMGGFVLAIIGTMMSLVVWLRSLRLTGRPGIRIPPQLPLILAVALNLIPLAIWVVKFLAFLG